MNCTVVYCHFMGGVRCFVFGVLIPASQNTPGRASGIRKTKHETRNTHSAGYCIRPQVLQVRNVPRRNSVKCCSAMLERHPWQTRFFAAANASGPFPLTI